MKIFSGRKKLDKKASMQLSINAIVILVMAMALLGLGLGLVRNLLGGGVGNLEAAIDSIDLSEQASAGKPLANINSLAVKQSTENPIAVSYYNNAGTICESNSNVILDINCINHRSTATPKEQFTLISSAVPVEGKLGTPVKVGAIAYTEAASGTYGCTVAIKCADNPQGKSVVEETAFVEITS